MKEHTKRSYRERVKASGLCSFQVAVKETDLWVSAGMELQQETRDLILDARYQLESYISTHPHFLSAMIPVEDDPTAPHIVRVMIDAVKSVGVGPMASVAGAIAEFVGRGLLEITNDVIVENGGDIFLKVRRDTTVSIFAGESPLSHKIGLRIAEGRMPLGVCTSSGTVGHSYSTGVADAGCVLASSAAFADGAATALCNRIRGRKDLARIAEWAESIPGVIGCLVILGEHMAVWGDVELVAVDH
ncbi:MAG: UPF0280 family protein [Desulfobacteraceae bacterium]|nr:MAG: UPF0280 family protein [Desulfobacteraceae bacterium]